MNKPTASDGFATLVRQVTDDVLAPLVPVVHWLLFDAPPSPLQEALTAFPRGESDALVLLLSALHRARALGGPRVQWQDLVPLFSSFAIAPFDVGIVWTTILNASCPAAPSD